MFALDGLALNAIAKAGSYLCELMGSALQVGANNISNRSLVYPNVPKTLDSSFAHFVALETLKIVGNSNLPCKSSLRPTHALDPHASKRFYSGTHSGRYSAWKLDITQHPDNKLRLPYCQSIRWIPSEVADYGSGIEPKARY